MASFDLRRLDVNLIVALQALLEEENVSAAARRLGVSQPAASRSLQKLRRHFGDPLLVRERGSLAMTPFAASLRPAVRQAVDVLSAVFASTGDFHAPTAERDFTVCASDYLIAVLGPRIIQQLAQSAPRCAVRFRALPPPAARSFAETLPNVDAIIVPHGMEPPGERLDLFTDMWCCVLDPAVARERAAWTPEALDSLEWVATELHPGVLPGVEHLRTRGLAVRLAATTTLFSAVPFAVRGTRRVGLVQRRLAEQIADAAGVTVVALPEPYPPLNLVAFYDPIRSRDPATRWFLDLLAREARTLQA